LIRTITFLQIDDTVLKQYAVTVLCISSVFILYLEIKIKKEMRKKVLLWASVSFGFAQALAGNNLKAQTETVLINKDISMRDLPAKYSFIDFNNDGFLSNSELTKAIDLYFDSKDSTLKRTDGVELSYRIDSLNLAGGSGIKPIITLQNTSIPTNTITPELVDTIGKIAELKAKLPFTFSGYIDANFFKNLNNPKNGSNLGLSGFERAFDQKENQFQIGLVQTKFGWSKKKVDAVIDLTFGPHADLGNYGNVLGPLGGGKGTTALNIKQAYITYKLNDKNSFTMGQFGTHIGMEVIEASINYHYSLSNLFNNGPFYHQGLKYTHTFNSSVALMAGVVNNWDNLYDNNRFRTAVAQLAITPKTGYSIYLNYIGGKEDNLVDTAGNTSFYGKDTINSFKQMVDLTANLQITEKFYVGINGAIGSKNNLPVAGDTTGKKRETRNWGGMALYMNYAFTPKISFGLRAEVFDNTQGVQYIGSTDVQSYTATFNFKLADGDILLRPEFRMDTYKKRPDINSAKQDQQFMDKDGKFTKNSQTTIGAALIYKF
jgi:hypothetical protein